MPPFSLLVAASLSAAALAAVPGGGRGRGSDGVPVWARGGSLYAGLLADVAAAGGAYGNSTPNVLAQPVDHNDASAGTFTQRWFVDWTHFSGAPTAPVLLYIGGEGPAGGTPGGFVAVQAAALGAVIVCLEHRYYGSSLPGAISDKALLMRTLSVEQALSDLVFFAANFTAEALGGSASQHPWVAVGGSYAGAMAAWARGRNPEVWSAAWSSSGVVEAVFRFTAFDEQVAADISAECADALRGITRRAEAAWAAPADRAKMLALFNAPGDLSREDFLWALADSGAMGAQYGAKDALCAAVLPVGADPLAQFAAWTAGHYGSSFMSQCYYNTACLSDASQSARWPNQLPWVWQCCSQLAYWQPGDFLGALRSAFVTTDYFTAQCQAAFASPGLVANTTGFNAVHGGKDSSATKVVALAGSDDPWQGACVNHSTPAKQVFYAQARCDGCGHCGDLSASANPALQAQHDLIAAKMKEWVA